MTCFCAQYDTTETNHTATLKRCAHTQTRERFDTAHHRFSSTITRGSKRATLVSVMETTVKELYERQLAMLCAKAIKSYKASLVKLLEGDALDEESEAEVLRKVRGRHCDFLSSI